ncbi:MAG TPA: alpha/beta hydrolase [Vicinamibacterales bacterium]|nr:alpha/beta hydrolase [Vicinamibacterales bacterium]
MPKRTRRALRIAVAAIVVAAATGAVYEWIGERPDRERLPQIGRSVDIGGRSLNIYCSGQGSPAVIFDSGAGESGFAWSHIQPRVAALTQACWFDRAGYGWSDPGPFPHTSAAIAADLHELLRREAIPRPYVMVGHSLGGLNIRVYNAMYPAEVAGAVLVDAAHEDEPRRAPKAMLGHTAPRFLWRPIWMAAEGARMVGITRLLLQRVALSDDPGQRTRDQIITALRAQPKTAATVADPSMNESYAQAERTGGFGNRPLVVLTRGRAPSHPPQTPAERERAAYEQIWMHEIQPKLARLSTRGTQIIVTKSGHYIPEEAPESIVQAVRDVIGTVHRDAQHGSGIIR